MKKNIGTADKIIRIMLTIGIGILYYLEVINGIGGFLLLLVAGALLGTVLLSFCPLYNKFGINTSGRVETGNR